MKYDCKKAVVVGMPQLASHKDGKMMNVSMASPMAETSSGPNLSKKFKFPSVSQDIPAEGRGQYE